MTVAMELLRTKKNSYLSLSNTKLLLSKSIIKNIPIPKFQIGILIEPMIFYSTRQPINKVELWFEKIGLCES